LRAGFEADIGVGACESDALRGGRTDGRIGTALFVTQAEIFSLKEQTVQARSTDLLFCCTCRIFAGGPFFGLSDISKHTEPTAAKTGILAIAGLRAFFGADAVAAAGAFGDTSVSIDTTDIFVVDLSAGFVGSSQLAFGLAVFFVGFDFGTRNARRAVRVLAARQITSAFDNRFTAAIEAGPTGIIQSSAAIERTSLRRRNTVARCTDLTRCTFRVFRARLPTDLLAILSLGLLDAGKPLFATCGRCGAIFAFFYAGSLLGVDLPSIGIFGDALAYRTIADLRCPRCNRSLSRTFRCICLLGNSKPDCFVWNATSNPCHPYKLPPHRPKERTFQLYRRYRRLCNPMRSDIHLSFFLLDTPPHTTRPTNTNTHSRSTNPNLSILFFASIPPNDPTVPTALFKNTSSTTLRS
jgi:hypothetical protein